MLPEEHQAVHEQHQGDDRKRLQCTEQALLHAMNNAMPPHLLLTSSKLTDLMAFLVTIILNLHLVLRVVISIALLKNNARLIRLLSEHLDMVEMNKQLYIHI